MLYYLAQAKEADHSLVDRRRESQRPKPEAKEQLPETRAPRVQISSNSKPRKH
jgi:hypothetical protein